MTAISFRLWLSAMLVLIAVFGFGVLPRLHVETDILALLPADEIDPGAEAALQAYADQGSRQAVFLVGAADFKIAKTAASAFAGALGSDADAFVDVQFEADRALLESPRFYLAYRGGLLSAQHRQWLQSGNRQALIDEAQRALYTASGWTHPFNASEDPLGLLSAFVAQALPSLGKASPREGVMTIQAKDGNYMLVSARTAASPFTTAAQQSAGAAIEAARAAAAAAGATEVIGSGVIQHAVAQARHARAEMTLFSNLSLAGSVLLLLFAFRSVRPLLLSAGAMACGAIAGVTACQWAFGNVHLLTLVFASSLIGTSVDYSFLFFADRLGGASAAKPARSVVIAILLGYLTSALSYAALLVAPFPGLRQVALFSAVGLGVACGCVLCLYPRWSGQWKLPVDSAPLRLAGLMTRMRIADRPRWVGVISAAAAVALLCGIVRLNVIDDVRALQSSPAELIRQEVKFRELLGQDYDSRLLLVRGDTAEQVLQREEDLRTRLESLKAAGGLGGFIAISNALPSLRRQAADRSLLQTQVYSSDGLLPPFLHQLGYEDQAVARKMQDFETQGAPLLPEVFIKSDAARPYRAQWLGRGGDGQFGSVVALYDLSDAAALQALVLNLPGVKVLDKVGDISNVLHRYRVIASGLLAGVYVIIGGLLAWRYGPGGALMTLTPALGGGLLALGALGWFGEALSLFHMLALLLVLGMGSDFAIFLRESRDAPVTALLAIALSTVTTALSFGLLAFSSTPFIRAIGLTTSLGLAFAFILAVALRPAPTQNLGARHV